MLDKLRKADMTQAIKGKAFPAVLIIVAIIGLYLFISNTWSRQVTGKAITIKMMDSAYESNQLVYIIVELENGDRVRAVMPEHFPFWKDEEVVLSEIPTKFFGPKEYRLLGYNNELENEEMP